jgi:hypothetical protein
MSMILRDDEGNEYAVVTGPLDSRVVVHLEHGDSVVRPFPTPVPSVAEALDRVRQVTQPAPHGGRTVLLRGDKEDALAVLIAAVRAEERARKAVVTTEPGR